MTDDLDRLLGSAVKNDHSRQVVSGYHIDQLAGQRGSAQMVLDLGCGDGNSVELFRKTIDCGRWIGLDLEYSPEVATRTRTDAEFCVYDGVHIPFHDVSFDVVYSNQVMEHVRRPFELLAEVSRVLKPGGVFVGSTSQLEPYHSHSVWNYTPYGFVQLLLEADFCVVEVRPSIDALTLMARRLLRRPEFLRVFWTTESPLNRMIGIAGKVTRKSHARINAVKLIFCGQFCFVARKRVEGRS